MSVSPGPKDFAKRARMLRAVWEQVEDLDHALTISERQSEGICHIVANTIRGSVLVLGATLTSRMDLLEEMVEHIDTIESRNS